MIKSVLVFIGGLAAVSAAIACCSLAGPGKPVKFGDQTNIIVWDSENKVEHFMRVAHFETMAKDFSFIAPTPTIPDIGESDSRAADVLSYLEPRDRAAESDASLPPAAATKAAVEVVQVSEAAGFIITTLKSSDSEALTKYLKDNKYKTSPGIEKWIKHYTDKNWYLNAFKFNGNPGDIKTKMARMSFKTDVPFNPYYVPDENRSDQSTQELYFISNRTYLGKVGDGSETYPDSDWAARIGDSSPILNTHLRLPNFNVDPSSVVTHFSASFPTKATDDVFFKETGFFGYSGRRYDRATTGIAGQDFFISLIGGVLALVFFGGLYYFWRKARLRRM